MAMRLLIPIAMLAACTQARVSSSARPAPATPPAERTMLVTPPSTPPSDGCIVLPQPSAPGHTSVEPSDMICTHGDTALSCPDGFDGAAAGCRPASDHGQPGAGRWCCAS